LLERISYACKSHEPLDNASKEFIFAEASRALKMFYLKQQVEGKLKAFREDYFV
jgi:hypothetical protein